jgi:hypothetical protein
MPHVLLLFLPSKRSRELFLGLWFNLCFSWWNWIRHFCVVVLNQEHTYGIALQVFDFTSSLVLSAHITMSWDILWLYKPYCFQLWDFMHCVVHACCLKSVYHFNWVRWIFPSGIDLCHRRQHCCSMYTIHFDIHDLCHLTHLTHQYESVLQHMMSSREWPPQPKLGLFESLSGWISYKLCQRHSPKDIYIRSWSSWSIIKTTKLISMIMRLCYDMPSFVSKLIAQTVK